MFLKSLVVFFGLVSIGMSLVHELEVYSEPNWTGDVHIFKSKNPDFGGLEDWVGAGQSYCALGFWTGWTNQNYSGSRGFLPGIESTRRCVNSPVRTIKSLRYQGPADSSTPSISFYDGDMYYGGNEVTVTARAANHFGITPNTLITTGPSSWIGYPNQDFTGLATCYRANSGEFGAFYVNSPIASVVLGCDSRPVDVYAVAGEIL